MGATYRSYGRQLCPGGVRGVPFETQPVAISTPMGGAIVVPISIDGTPAWAMVDTGASITAIDAGWALRLGLRPEGATSIQSDLGAAFLDRVKSPSVSLGGDLLPLTTVLSTPLASLTQTLGRAISMIIGQDAFAHKLLEIDMPNRQLLLHEPVAAPTRLGFRRLELLRGPQGRRYIKMLIEGAPVSAVFDLGSSNPVMISMQLASQQKLLQGRKLSSAATKTLDGVSLSTTFRLRDLSIAGFRLPDAPAEAFANWDCEEVPANLGLPAFQDFRMLIDFTGDTLWLARPEGTVTPFRVDRSGLGLAFEGDHLTIVHVAAGGPAEAAGLRASTKIVAIDGRLLDADYLESGLCEWRYGPVGRSVQLTMADGKHHRFVLQDYI